MFAYQLFESFFFVNSLKNVLQDKTISNQIHVRLRMSRNQFVCVIKPDFCVLDTCRVPLVINLSTIKKQQKWLYRVIKGFENSK